MKSFPPRLPYLLYSYVASELLAPFFASFVILYSVFFLVRLIPLLEVVLNLRIGLADFIRICSYILPHMLFYVMPMAAMTGVIIGFTRLTNDKEILALKACGISLRMMMPPVIVVALCIAMLTGLISVKLIPAGETAIQQLMFQLAREKIEKGIKEKTFTEALGDLVVYVDEIQKDGKWRGVYVSDMRNRTQPLITMAKAGYMDADAERMLVTIVLTQGTMHNAEARDNQVIDFQRYQLQIPLKPPTTIGGDDVTVLERGSMTQKQLLQAADKLGRDHERANIFLTEYYSRYTLPFGCLILSLLGMPLGLQARPGRKAIGIPMGLAFFIFYHFFSTFFEILAEDNALPVVIAMWFPNILFLCITLYVFYRVDKEKTMLPEKKKRCCLKSYSTL